jgi:chromosome segregation ATPase
LVFHAALGNRGSMSTLVRLKTEIEAEVQPVSDSEEGLKAFREIWALAIEEGRKQREEEIADLRENLKTLAVENERLDGVATAAQDRIEIIEKAKSQAEAELVSVRSRFEEQLHQAQAAQIQSSEQARQVLEQLAQEKTAHSMEVSRLQHDLATAVQKAHEFEIELARARALLEVCFKSISDCPGENLSCNGNLTHAT